MTQTLDIAKQHPDIRKPTIVRLSQAGITVGTLIMTPNGLLPIEDLTAGDRILTKDYGYQQVQCVAFRDVDLVRSPHLSPILLRADTLGAERPLGDFYVAPTQRLALRHPLFDLMFGAREVVACARDLVHLAGINQVEGLTGITYVMLGFTRSQMIFTGSLVLDICLDKNDVKRPILSSDEARLACSIIAPPPATPICPSLPLH